MAKITRTSDGDFLIITIKEEGELMLRAFCDAQFYAEHQVEILSDLYFPDRDKLIAECKAKATKYDKLVGEFEVFG